MIQLLIEWNVFDVCDQLFRICEFDYEIKNNPKFLEEIFYLAY